MRAPKSGMYCVTPAAGVSGIIMSYANSVWQQQLSNNSKQ